MKFEEKMSKLEKIILELENNEISLDESINKYTEAMELIKDCDKELKQIEDKVLKIIDENGKEEV